MGRHSAPGAPTSAGIPDDGAFPAGPAGPAELIPHRGRHTAAEPIPVAAQRAPEPESPLPDDVRHPHEGRPAAHPVVELLCWTSFAAAVAWVIIAASGRGVLAASRWPLGLAALVPVALLIRAPGRLGRDRHTHRRDE